MDLGNAVTVSHEHVSDAEIYNIDITAYHHRKKIPLVVVFDVATQKLKVNGKPCKAVQHAEDEQEKLYRDRVKACHDRGEPVCADDFEYPRYKGNKEDK